MFRIASQNAEVFVGRRAQQPTGRPIGKGRLADAFRPGEQPSMVQPTTPTAVLQRLFRPFVTGEFKDLPRVARLSHGYPDAPG